LVEPLERPEKGHRRGKAVGRFIANLSGKWTEAICDLQVASLYLQGGLVVKLYAKVMLE